MTQQQKHVPEMDFLRAFAILAVLAIHVSAGFTAIPQINTLMVVNIVIDVFSQCAVPLFIFISGFLLYLKYNKNYSLKEFYQKRFWRIIPPYLVFTTLYLVYPIVIAALKTGMVTLPSFLQVLYTYASATGHYHLWFFLIIIELYLLYPLIVKIYNFFSERHMGFLFLLLSLVLQLGWQVFGNSLHISLLGYTIPISNNQIFLCRLFYFVLGIYICNHYPAIKEWVLKKPIWFFAVLATVCTAITSLQWVESYSGILRPMISGSPLIFEQLANLFFTYAYLLLPLFYTITFAFLFRLSNKMVQSKHQFKWLSIISLYSFGIYLIHPFIQERLVTVLRLFGITVETIIYYPLVFVVVLLSSMLFVYIVRKFPFYKYIIG